MNIKKTRLILLSGSILLNLLFPHLASAQSVVCSKTMEAKSCDLLAEPVEVILKELAAPADWTWVILDGREWKRASRMFKTEKNTSAAFTVFESRTTFFSASYLQTEASAGSHRGDSARTGPHSLQLPE